MTGDWRISSLQYGLRTGLRREGIREIIRCAVTDSIVTTGDFRTDIGDSVPAPLRFIRLRISGGLSQKMKDSEVLILRRSPPFYPQLASRSLLSVALLGCLPSLDAAVCVMRLHGLFFGTVGIGQTRLTPIFSRKHGIIRPDCVSVDFFYFFLKTP